MKGSVGHGMNLGLSWRILQKEEIYPSSFGCNFVEIHLTYSTPHTFKIYTLNFDMHMYTDALVTTAIKIAICILDKLTYQ